MPFLDLLHSFSLSALANLLSKPPTPPPATHHATASTPHLHSKLPNSTVPTPLKLVSSTPPSNKPLPTNPKPASISPSIKYISRPLPSND